MLTPRITTSRRGPHEKSYLSPGADIRFPPHQSAGARSASRFRPGYHCIPGRRRAAVSQPRGRSRSEERRVGKECRSRWSPEHYKEKECKEEIETQDIGETHSSDRRV